MGGVPAIPTTPLDAVAASRDLTVAEMFASMQGEGPSAGRPTVFLRLGGCNLTCAWCDSAYTWDGKRFDLRAELRRMTAAEVIAEVERLAGEHIRRLTITGGEPLLQGGRLVPVLRWARAQRFTIEVETNGTLTPPPDADSWIDEYRVSPKLAHAGIPDGRRLRLAALRRFVEMPAARAIFKVVVRYADDLAEVARLCAAAGIAPGRVWVMAEGIDAAGQIIGMRAMADAALAAGYNLSPRLHVLIWEDRRGV